MHCQAGKLQTSLRLMVQIFPNYLSKWWEIMVGIKIFAKNKGTQKIL
jgi:hypothetical protein